MICKLTWHLRTCIDCRFHLVFVAGDLEALAGLLHPHHGHVGQQLLVGRGVDPGHGCLKLARLCCIEIQVRPNQDRGHFLALYLVRRASFWVSSMPKILFAYTKNTFCGSIRYRTCIWFWFADPNFMYRAQPCKLVKISSTFKSRRCYKILRIAQPSGVYNFRMSSSYDEERFTEND